MLPRTFCHIPGIGPKTERRLWQQGALDWEHFLAEPTRFSAARSRLPQALDIVRRSRDALARQDAEFFAGMLPSRETWRAWPEFPGRVVCLDIETDGGTEAENITVIGIADGSGLRQFVRGENLLEFEDALDDTAVLVTYFGAGFDIPVLRRAFPRMPWNRLHFDLCPAMRRLGYRGGLKAIEHQLSVARAPEVQGLDGWAAVRLWREWQYGSEEARRLLLAYNAADVLNLAPLAEITYGRFLALCGGQEPSAQLGASDGQPYADN